MSRRWRQRGAAFLLFAWVAGSIIGVFAMSIVGIDQSYAQGVGAGAVRAYSPLCWMLPVWLVILFAPLLVAAGGWVWDRIAWRREARA